MMTTTEKEICNIRIEPQRKTLKQPHTNINMVEEVQSHETQQDLEEKE